MKKKIKIIEFSGLNNNLKYACEEYLNKYNFCVIRNFLDNDNLISSKKLIFKKLSKFNNNSKLDPLRNSYEHRKIKGKNKIKKNVIEIFNPDTDKDIYKLRNSFRKMINLRNLLLGLPKYKKTFTHKNQNYFTSNRIMYYQSNEGYLDSHYDKKAGDYTKQKFGKYFQILASLTKKGEDYNFGGGIIFQKNKKIFIDNYLNYGDILIYNEKLKHGVDKVIAKNNKYSKGRISILVTFYKKFKISK